MKYTISNEKFLYTIDPFSFSVSGYALEPAQTESKSKPVRYTFETSRLIDNQTVATPYKKGLELEIHHRSA
jgi:hypothetical protein